MHANNETGTIEPIEACARIAREHRVLFHTDAAQSVGKIATRVEELGVDLLSIAGHKLYAPKGIGALYIRTGVRLEPLIHGAGHERGRRAGTESALLSSALGTACAIARDLSFVPEMQRLRDLFWDLLQERFGTRVVLNGHPDRRLPNTLNASFVGRVGADILAAMPEVAASTGSACHSGQIRLSPVLAAMGLAAEVGMGTHGIRSPDLLMDRMLGTNVDPGSGLSRRRAWRGMRIALELLCYWIVAASIQEQQKFRGQIGGEFSGHMG